MKAPRFHFSKNTRSVSIIPLLSAFAAAEARMVPPPFAGCPAKEIARPASSGTIVHPCGWIEAKMKDEIMTTRPTRGRQRKARTKAPRNRGVLSRACCASRGPHRDPARALALRPSLHDRVRRRGFWRKDSAPQHGEKADARDWQATSHSRAIVVYFAKHAAARALTPRPFRGSHLRRTAAAIRRHSGISIAMNEISR